VAGDAALTGFPVAGRQIVQHQLEPVLLELFGDLRRFERIREQELDALEAGARSFAEAVEESDLVEQHRQVGS
jgi:hypothetical protein